MLVFLFCTALIKWKRSVHSEHKELSRQIQQCVDYRLRDDLERDLDDLVARMEAKGEQIARLRKLQEMVSCNNSSFVRIELKWPYDVVFTVVEQIAFVLKCLDQICA